MLADVEDFAFSSCSISATDLVVIDEKGMPESCSVLITEIAIDEMWVSIHGSTTGCNNTESRCLLKSIKYGRSMQINAMIDMTNSTFVLLQLKVG